MTNRATGPGIWSRLLALTVLVAVSPLCVAISGAIWLINGSPIFYRARRLGINGTEFDLLKFRTMHVGSQPVIDNDLKVIVVPNDRRVTAIGRLLRCGLDEIPQLWNVFKREMNWVGPRPDEPWILPYYGSSLLGRLSLVPGITGLAQVLDSRSLVASEGYALDLWYCIHRTRMLDIVLLLWTPLYVLGWRTIGANTLRRIRKSEEFQQLLAQCQKELACLSVDEPQLNSTGAEQAI